MCFLQNDFLVDNLCGLIKCPCNNILINSSIVEFGNQFDAVFSNFTRFARAKSDTCFFPNKKLSDMFRATSLFNFRAFKD